MSPLTAEQIDEALNLARLKGFTGRYSPLGGGEVNNTYKLDLGDRQAILRIAKDEGQQSLIREARALQLLESPRIPNLIYFNKNQLINGRMWILEDYLTGVTKIRLTLEQYKSLGRLLADVHKVTDSETHINLREQFLDGCKVFGNEQALLSHPHPEINRLVNNIFKEFEQYQECFDKILPSLLHSDATPSNILVDDNEVGLIDWEFSRFSDAMADFATVYYEDMAYHKGSWRVHIEPNEKQALFDGYEAAGGVIDEKRIKYWIHFDKITAAVFLYWRLNESKRPTTEDEKSQYYLDLDAILSTLTTLS